MAKKKHADTIESMELCEGVYLQEEFFEKKENRVLTLLLKGFIVYLLSMGSIGFYLTAFDISFDFTDIAWLCNVVLPIDGGKPRLSVFVCHLCISGIYIPRLHQQWILCDREHHGR